MNHALRSSVRTALAPAVARGGTRYGRGGRPDDLYLYWRCGMRFYAYFRGSRARWRTSRKYCTRGQALALLHFFVILCIFFDFVWRFHIFRLVVCTA